MYHNYYVITEKHCQFWQNVKGCMTVSAICAKHRPVQSTDRDMPRCASVTLNRRPSDKLSKNNSILVPKQKHTQRQMLAEFWPNIRLSLQKHLSTQTFGIAEQKTVETFDICNSLGGPKT